MKRPIDTAELFSSPQSSDSGQLLQRGYGAQQMTALLGRLPTDHRCGAGIAVIGPGNGEHPATLACPQCGSRRGAITIRASAIAGAT